MELNGKQKRYITNIYRKRPLKDSRDLNVREFEKVASYGEMEDLYLHINAHIKTLRKKDGTAGKIPWRNK